MKSVLLPQDESYPKDEGIRLPRKNAIFKISWNRLSNFPVPHGKLRVFISGRSLNLQLQGNPPPDSHKSSALAAIGIVGELRRRVNHLRL